MDDHEEKDLKLAIALSLQDENNPSGKPGQETIVIDDGGGETVSHSPLSNPSLSMGAAGRLATSLLGLDRAAMERERLERKRKASGVSPTLPAMPYSSKKVKVDECSDSAQFPHGAVRKTWVQGFARDEDITIEEVLQKEDLQLAVLSSFQWDFEWLLTKVDLKKSKMIMVMGAKDEATKTQYRQETAQEKNLRLCFPPMPGNCSIMHSKLMLLSHPTSIRIVVPTANAVPYDWGETGNMENSLFLIDLPRLPDGRRVDENDLTPFGQDLIYFCRAMGLPDEVVNSLLNFDFVETQEFAFVHSIGGPHEGAHEPWKRTGYCGLGRAVSQLGLGHRTRPLEVDFVASSIGSLSSDFLTALYLAAQGDDGTTELALRTPSAAKHLSDARKLPASKETIVDRFRMYFPSSTTVASSRGGPNAAGTVCFQEQWFNSPKFPRGRLRDCLSTRPGLLMHNKIMYVRPQDGLPTQDEESNGSIEGPHVRPWAYVGSANLSESAWGKLVFDRSAKRPRLTCRNWECGVLVPVRRAMGTGDKGLDVFEGTVPVPMRVPAAELNEERKPWFFRERMNAMD